MSMYIRVIPCILNACIILVSSSQSSLPLFHLITDMALQTTLHYEESLRYINASSNFIIIPVSRSIRS